MIQEITIENYKSIQSLSIELGRVTVFIGENGCGKSNILEAIALGSAAAADKLDNEFLAPRGIRVTEPKLMRSAFDVENLDKEIRVSFKPQNKEKISFILQHNNQSYSSWEYKLEGAALMDSFSKTETSTLISRSVKKEKEEISEYIRELDEISVQIDEIFITFEEKLGELDFDRAVLEKSLELVNKALNNLFSNSNLDIELIQNKVKEMQRTQNDYLKMVEELKIKANRQLEELNELEKINNDHILTLMGIKFGFLLFCIQFSFLKEFEKEGQIQPLGINGEGLFKYLRYLSQPQFKEKLDEIKEKLELIDWFDDFDIPDNLYPGERTLKIKDRYLDPDLEYFDQRSANEGFLFLLFYFCLFIGEETPKFFAIDNIDSSLNPRLCRRLIEELVELAKKHDKQVILTTHNPAVLDGLDLHDEEQKLYVINRKLSGCTRANRIFPLKAPEGKDPVRLSEAFLRGYIGGLPENF
jgi:predicted ATPase